MTAGGQVHPAEDSWVAAIHASAADFDPLGAGVVIDERRVLTCAHVVAGLAGPWVAFPKAWDTGQRCLVEGVVLPDAHAPVKDLAILVLAEPVPATVTPAPLRSPRPADLAGRRWWAFGFPAGDPVGNPADGSVGAALGYGWIRLDAESRYHVDPGFSGSGLWSPDYAAVIAIVGQANDRGDGRAITLHQASACFPDQNLNQLSERFEVTLAGPLALSAWGWSLAGDPEGRRHWRPRASGAGIGSERGYRFRGRTAALRTITAWLDRLVPDRRVLVVTGAPGAGKSAVLGRVVTTADASAAAELPGWDAAVRATAGSVACAVHAKGKTAFEIATEIARAASASLPEKVEDFAPALRDALAGRGGRRFNVIIDALDESAEARTVIAKVILPLAETCADAGAQVIAGSRRRDDGGDLLDALGPAVNLVDLDDARFFAEADLAAYAQATLQLDRPGNPYAGDDIAVPVAARIAELSAGNFLIAGLIASAHGRYDDEPADPASLSFTATVGAAMHEYLRRLPPVLARGDDPPETPRHGGLPPPVSPWRGDDPPEPLDGVSAEMLLTALALAEPPGLTAELWQTAVRALGAGDVPAARLTRFARSAAANFLVESSGQDGQSTVYRLFHAALDDALLRARGQVATREDDERSLTAAFIAAGRGAGWRHAPGYLLRSLPAHAARAGMVDDLLTDDEYLLHADLAMLLPWVYRAGSAAARQRARLLRLTPRSRTADPLTRTALFSITETVEQAGDAYARSTARTPYRAVWAVTTPSAEELVLEGHTDAVRCVCALSVDGRTLLASGGDDRTVRIWDPATGTQQAALSGHASWINALCPVTVDGRVLLAAATGRTVRIWDPATGARHSALDGHTGWVTAVHGFTLGGRALLATAGYDQTVRIWDLATGTGRLVLRGHTDQITSLCTVTVGHRTLLASAGGHDETVRIWDPVTGIPQGIQAGHSHGVSAICAFSQGGRDLLAAGCGDGIIRVWDPATGTQLPGLRNDDGRVRSVCARTVNDRTLLVIAGGQRVEIWDPATATRVATLRGHSAKVRSVAAFDLGGRALAASAADDQTVRIWDAAAGAGATGRERASGVRQLSAFTQDGRTRLASSGDDGTVRFRDPGTGTEIPGALDHCLATGPVCALTADRRPLLAVGGPMYTVGVWDVATGSLRTSLTGHAHTVTALCAFSSAGATLLASGSYDQTVRVWEPVKGTEMSVLTGHSSWISVLHAFTSGGRPLLAAGYGDGTVGIWDPATGTIRGMLQGHLHTVAALRALTLGGRTMLATGSHDQTAAVYDPATGTRESVLEGHSDWVTAVSAFTAGRRTLLVTGSRDRTLRIWDPATGTALLTVPVRHPVRDLCHADGMLIAGTTAGLVAIRLDPGFLQ